MHQNIHIYSIKKMIKINYKKFTIYLKTPSSHHYPRTARKYGKYKRKNMYFVKPMFIFLIPFCFAQKSYFIKQNIKEKKRNYW